MKIFRKFSIFLLSIMILSRFEIAPVSAELQESHESYKVKNNFTFSLIDDSYYVITGYNGEDSIVEIPELMEGIPVSGIGTMAFCQNKNITDIVLPTTIKFIDDRAFTYCTNLESVSFSEGLTTIEDNAFNGCSSLVSVSFPETLNTIGSSAFRNCSNLSAIQFNSDFMSVGYDAFANTAWYANQEDGYICFENVLYSYKGTMPNNEILEVSDTITCIAECAMRNQVNLSDVIFHENIHSIGWGAFKNTGIRKLNLPFISVIKASTFSGCKELKTVTIPSSVKSIEFEAFAGCKSLSEVEISNDIVCTIDIYAFDDCPSLTQIQLPKSINAIGQSAFGYYISEQIDCEIMSCPVENFTIVGYKNSVAETYAIENGFRFIALDADTVAGDVNADGSFGVSDVILLQKWLLAVPGTNLANWKAADFCEDGKLNIFDLCLMKKMLVKES
ncbi:MAG: leucine-rich repeat protein [Oscillospiraceae bacterium]|nr:leucine-rich repeat protein [Oscillospiraceae bacterium]